MLSREDIRREYPTPLQEKGVDMLREYLQYIFLEGISLSPYADRLYFIGGTALRIIHDNQRFSEDLDFDNHGLTRDMFEKLIKHLEQYLQLLGLTVDIILSKHEAFHANFKIRYILTQYNLAPQTRPEIQQKLHLKIDTHDQGYDFIPEIKVLQRFGIRSTIQVAPLPLLMAQKIRTIGERKRSKGRDYVDLIFLQKKQVRPDYGYLKQFLGIENPSQLKKYLLDIIAKKDKNRLIRDVQPFLFNPYDDSIKHFELYVKEYAR